MQSLDFIQVPGNATEAFAVSWTESLQYKVGMGQANTKQSKFITQRWVKTVLQKNFGEIEYLKAISSSFSKFHEKLPVRSFFNV